MSDKKLIVTGLLIFMVIVTFPFWFNRGKAAPLPQPVLTDKAKAAKVCVRSTAFMRAEHMRLLDFWRESVVRLDKRIYVSPDGKEYVMSLSNTCLDCHSNKTEFCDRCHNYASVNPYCWSCHIENPKEAS
jgi:hypothetical protein